MSVANINGNESFIEENGETEKAPESIINPREPKVKENGVYKNGDGDFDKIENADEVAEEATKSDKVKKSGRKTKADALDKINTADEDEHFEETMTECHIPKKNKKRVKKAIAENISNGSGKRKGSASVSEAENGDTKRTKNRNKKGRNPLYVMSNPRTIDMITEAIDYLQESKGSSVRSIKNYILENYKVDEGKINHLMRRAFDAGLKNNVIVRPPNQATPTGLLLGRYLVSPESTKKSEPPKPRPTHLRQLSTDAKKPKNKKKKKKRRNYY